MGATALDVLGDDAAVDGFDRNDGGDLEGFFRRELCVAACVAGVVIDFYFCARRGDVKLFGGPVVDGDFIQVARCWRTTTARSISTAPT